MQSIKDTFYYIVIFKGENEDETPQKLQDFIDYISIYNFMLIKYAWIFLSDYNISALKRILSANIKNNDNLFIAKIDGHEWEQYGFKFLQIH